MNSKLPHAVKVIIDTLCAYKIDRCIDDDCKEMLRLLGNLKNIQSSYIRLTKDYIIYKFGPTINIIHYVDCNELFFNVKPIKAISVKSEASSYSDWLKSNFTKNNHGYVKNNTSLTFSFNSDDIDAITSFLVKPTTTKK